MEAPDRNAHFKKFELSREQHVALAERVRQAGRHYMASVWDVEMLEWIDAYIEIHKVGSGDLTSYPMLKALAATGKPIILSTGLASMEEIRKARSNSSMLRTQAIALSESSHSCNAPRPIPRLTRRSICASLPTLRETFNLPAGYSDHTVGTDAIELAYALGARIFEKHFTDMREGKAFRDHHVSLTKDEVQHLLARLRRSEILLGSAEKALTEAEARRFEHEISFRRGLHAGRCKSRLAKS